MKFKKIRSLRTHLKFHMIHALKNDQDGDAWCLGFFRCRQLRQLALPDFWGAGGGFAKHGSMSEKSQKLHKLKSGMSSMRKTWFCMSNMSTCWSFAKLELWSQVAGSVDSTLAVSVREESVKAVAVRADSVDRPETDVADVAAENSDTLVHISGLCVRAPSDTKWLKKKTCLSLIGVSVFSINVQWTLSIQARFLQVLVALWQHPSIFYVNMLWYMQGHQISRDMNDLRQKKHQIWLAELCVQWCNSMKMWTSLRSQLKTRSLERILLCPLPQGGARRFAFSSTCHHAGWFFKTVKMTPFES